ncbi:MAG TPA: protein translocase subunit SecF [Candidatus Woesearchaeota archaeon]|nr:protein translocase subunit SecF [Candidatus Woesearchaeota archaeon]
MNFAKEIYKKQYKRLILITLTIVVLSIVQIAYQYSATGEFINRGISLKGGTSLSVFVTEEFNLDEIQTALISGFPDHEFEIKSIKSTQYPFAFIVESTLEADDSERLLNTVKGITGPLANEDYSLEVIGPTLGEGFFRQVLVALAFAFLLMALVVWFHFKAPVPSLAVVLSAFTDIVVTVAIVNLMGIRISSAGIAAFLMLIGYSVDTDILLATRLLKKKGEDVFTRLIGAMKTGLTMSFTSLGAVIIALVVSNSLVIQQIMQILLIGLIVDLFSTWIQNAGILRMYAEKNEKKG